MKTSDIEDNLTQLLNLENLGEEYKHFQFHHIGIATNNIEEAFEDYQLISYKKGDSYIEENIGVKAMFALNENMPTLEILENLPEHHFLDIYLKNFMKVFHQGYLVDNFAYCKDLLVNKLGGKIISDIYKSEYFKGKCCYILMPDRFTIEIIENKTYKNRNYF